MADINKIDLTDIEDTLKGSFESVVGFQLTDYGINGTLALASGRTEEIGGFTYRVEGGDLIITDPGGIPNGYVYVLIQDDGDDTASAYLSTKGGTWDPNKGGYYVNDASPDNGARVLFKAIKDTGPIYSAKGRISGKIVSDRLDDDDERSLLFALIF
ncbi:MAG: hypothetical protein GWN64_07980 [Candidatus Thorarchaeota archaeon]|nr:hypothetical protein [Candidatus Thorarchaeota archaeon]